MNFQIFVSRAACTNNQCLHKISFQLLSIGLYVLLQADYDKMNKIHERSLRLSLKNYKKVFKIFLGPLVIYQSINDV